MTAFSIGLVVGFLMGGVFLRICQEWYRERIYIDGQEDWEDEDYDDEIFE